MTRGTKSRAGNGSARECGQSLAILIYALWWIKNGSQAPKRLDKARNDIIDLSFAVYGTYFAGLMTDDAKAHWMHDNLSTALIAVGARLGMVVAEASSPSHRRVCGSRRSIARGGVCNQPSRREMPR
ncbi:hypothetical protein AB4Z01_05330 [Inquilinus sp. YAF38]|uniref:hypothetical protein n=1 Tax=Inquilinus sp. YAF38 TaxID=3233084 RepID=UPI003F8F2919